MERYRAAPKPENLVHPPPSVAVWYREQVSPVPPCSSSSVNLHEPHALQTAEAGEDRSQSVQIYPAPDAGHHQLESPHSTSAHILTKIASPYDAQQKYLERMLKRLRQPTSTMEASDEVEADSSVPQIATYPTAFGTFSFPELYERSRKYAAFVLHHRFYMQPNDLEDGLQAGAITLWESLQQQPEGLEDKTMAWIGMRVVYTALHATRGDWNYRQKTQAEEGEGSKNGWEPMRTNRVRQINGPIFIRPLLRLPSAS